MVEHVFNVIIQADADLSDEQFLDLTDRLGKAGCLDATLSGHESGIVATFDREAASLADAIRTAVRDVSRAGCRIVRVEITPDQLQLEQPAAAS